MKIRATVALTALALAGALFGSAALASEGGLSLPAGVEDPVRIELPHAAAWGGDPAFSELLQVFVGEEAECCAGRTPVAGRYEVDAGILSFTPAFGFVAGQAYVLRTRGLKGGGGIAEELTAFRIPPDAPDVPPEVTAIHPSGDVLPENTLRFYIHFSTPMQPHVAFDHIKLVDASGHADPAAFMRFKQELWSADRRRLTVLMDPGRIKRGVAANLELGPALVEGRRYSLVVEGGWPAANGAARLAAFSRSFVAGAALRTLPDAADWTITPPTAGTLGPLTIEFDRPFDSERLGQDIRVQTAEGRDIAGRISVDRQETRWSFRPESPWSRERLRILVDVRMEDVAGNNFRDLLDHSTNDRGKDANENVIIVEPTR